MQTYCAWQFCTLKRTWDEVEFSRLIPLHISSHSPWCFNMVVRCLQIRGCLIFEVVRLPAAQSQQQGDKYIQYTHRKGHPMAYSSRPGSTWWHSEIHQRLDNITMDGGGLVCNTRDLLFRRIMLAYMPARPTHSLTFCSVLLQVYHAGTRQKKTAMLWTLLQWIAWNMDMKMVQFYLDSWNMDLLEVGQLVLFSQLVLWQIIWTKFLLSAVQSTFGCSWSIQIAVL